MGGRLRGHHLATNKLVGSVRFSCDRCRWREQSWRLFVAPLFKTHSVANEGFVSSYGGPLG